MLACSCQWWRWMNWSHQGIMSHHCISFYTCFKSKKTLHLHIPSYSVSDYLIFLMSFRLMRSAIRYCVSSLTWQQCVGKRQKAKANHLVQCPADQCYCWETHCHAIFSFLLRLYKLTWKPFIYGPVHLSIWPCKSPLWKWNFMSTFRPVLKIS